MSWGSRTRKCEIVIDHTEVPSGGPGSSWPMLLAYHAGGSSNLPSEPLDADGSYPAKSDGGDLMVASDSAGSSRLALEVVTWDNDNDPASNAEAQLWTADPDGVWEPSSVADTSLWIGYGDASASQPAADSTYGSENVWDSDYVAVYHLEEDPSDSAPQMLDSTSNGNDGTSQGSMTSGDSVTGQIGQGLDFDENDDMITASAGWPAPPWTAEVWANPRSSPPSYAGVVVQYPFGSPDQSGIFFRTGGQWYYQAYGTGGSTGDIHSLDTGWHHVAITSTAESFYDGASQGTSAAPTGNTASGISIGGYSGGVVDAQIDEVRLSSTVRSDAWLAANHASQDDPSTFATAGTPESALTPQYLGAFQPPPQIPLPPPLTGLPY